MLLKFSKHLIGKCIQTNCSSSLNLNPIFYKSLNIDKKQVDLLIKTGKQQLITSILSEFGSWDRWFESFSQYNINPKLLFELLKSKEITEPINIYDLSRKHQLFISIGIELNGLLKNYVNILLIDYGKLESMILLLKNYMSPRNVIAVIEKDPAILASNSLDVEEAINHARRVMRVPLETVVNSKIWYYPKSHLIIRHKFLYLSGIYPENGKAKLENHSVANFQRLINSTDNEFASEIAMMPIDEFVLFKNNFDLLSNEVK